MNRAMRHCLVLAAIISSPLLADDPTNAGPQRVESASQDARPSADRRAIAARARASLPSQGWEVPVEPDLLRNVERLLVLLPDRPLIVDVVTTIDGEPYRTHRERLVAEMLKSVDADGDGEVAWVDLLAASVAQGDRLSQMLRNAQQREQFVKQHDLIENGLVEPVELRYALARIYGGPALTVFDYGGRYAMQTGAPIKAFLDADGNGELSAEELNAVAERLRSRDTDDNEIVDAVELGPAAAAGRGGGVPVQNPQGAAQTVISKPLLLHLSEESNWLLATEPLSAYLQLGDSEDSPLRLVHQLDADGDRKISEDEARGLLEADPHLVVAVSLGEKGDAAAGISLTSSAEELSARVSTEAATITLEFPGARLQLQSADAPTNFAAYQTQSKAILARFDADKNGYLERKELEEGQGAIFGRNFEQWDGDGDGKVFPEEIEKAYKASYEPMINRVTIAAAEQGDSLLSAIDVSGDGRVGLREMRTARERLLATDENGDGLLSREEIPLTIRVVVGRTNAIGQAFYSGVRPAAARTDSGGPRWHVHMDTNGDGDVSRREFLGTGEQFHMLDVNSDGFIEPAEAHQAAKSG